MTAAEWRAATDPRPMLELLHQRGSASDRKLRLFACACCRRVLCAPHGGGNDKDKRDIAVAEQLADGTAQREALCRARDWQWGCYSVDVHFAGCIALALDQVPFTDARCIHSFFVCLLRSLGVRYEQDESEDTRRQTLREGDGLCQLLREVVGNPFRPAPALDAAWLAWHDGSVAQLARAAYDERLLPEGTLDPARLAVLADALEDAGCPDAELLGHLRGPGPHVRGCWALDLVLRKG